MKSYPFLLFYFACGSEVWAKNETFNGIISLNANLSSGEPFSIYTSEYQAIFDLGVHDAQPAATCTSLTPTGYTFDWTPINNTYFGLSELKRMGFESIF